MATMDMVQAATGNATLFARHYLAASGTLVAALALPSAKSFTYALAEAKRSSNAAGTELEAELAQSLARNIRDSALEFGYRIEASVTVPLDKV